MARIDGEGGQADPHGPSGRRSAEKLGRWAGQEPLPGGSPLPDPDRRRAYERRREAIIREAQLDAVDMLRTSEPADRLPTERWWRSRMTRVERAFRLPEDRRPAHGPIRHRVESRVRAHLFLCLLAYYVHWHLRQARPRWEFDAEDLRAERARRDPVLAAQTVRLSQTEEEETPHRGRVTAAEPRDAMAHLGTRARTSADCPRTETRLASRTDRSRLAWCQGPTSFPRAKA